MSDDDYFIGIISKIDKELQGLKNYSKIRKILKKVDKKERERIIKDLDKELEIEKKTIKGEMEDIMKEEEYLSKMMKEYV